MNREALNVTHYIEKPRHWCPLSENYTGVDRLLSAVLEGWKIHRNVYRHEILRRMSRKIVVYYFELEREDAVVTMAVINNPRVASVIAEYRLRVITNTVLEATERETIEVKRVVLEEETIEAPVVAASTRLEKPSYADSTPAETEAEQVAVAS